MSDRLFAGHEPFSIYHRSTAALIVALLWLLTLVLAVSLETATRGTMIAAMMPRIVTTANNSISEKPARLRIPIDFIAVLRIGTVILSPGKMDPFYENEAVFRIRLCKRRSQQASVGSSAKYFRSAAQINGCGR